MLKPKDKATPTDLNQALAEMTKLKLDLTTNQLKDTSQLKKLRAKIAIIKTSISQTK